VKYLGISAFYHDSAAALVDDGRIIAAAQEERFSREKHDARFPHAAIDYCLKEAGIDLNGVDHVVFYDKPFLKFERLLETYLAYAPKGFRTWRMALPLWVKDKLFQKSLLAKELKKLAPEQNWSEKLLFTEHHQSHAASAYYPSPFDEAVVLTMDGVGEWATTSFAIGRGAELELRREINFPHSLGLLYSAFTYYTGFKVNSGEYKVMGLAPYGIPKYKDLILDNLIDLKPDGTFRLNMDYFDYPTGLTMTNRRFDRLFGALPHRPEEQLTQREMDIAASIQAVTEEVMLRMARALAAETGIENLCLAGGVALNCVANGKLLRDGAFKRIWLQPAAGDAGGALGAALCAAHHFHGTPKSRNGVGDNRHDAMQGAYLGPSFGQKDVEVRLTAAGAHFEVFNDDALEGACVEAIASGQALGWFQGRMEFGPRALGARSILADPRSQEMQETLNLRVKYRESFRPFAPAVLREDLSDWFEIDVDCPYMQFVAEVAKQRQVEMTDEQEQLFGIEKLNIPRSDIPAVTHVDYSARVQSVHKETNAKFHSLLSRFKAETDCSVLVNTSFNVRGEPIVCTPEDAFHCFMGTGIEALAIGNCFLRKEDQDQDLIRNYKDRFDLD
jgi:carbamoyltransferase